MRTSHAWRWIAVLLLLLSLLLPNTSRARPVNSDDGNREPASVDQLLNLYDGIEARTEIVQETQQDMERDLAQVQVILERMHQRYDQTESDLDQRIRYRIADQELKRLLQVLEEDEHRVAYLRDVLKNSPPGSRRKEDTITQARKLRDDVDAKLQADLNQEDQESLITIRALLNVLIDVIETDQVPELDNLKERLKRARDQIEQSNQRLKRPHVTAERATARLKSDQEISRFLKEESQDATAKRDQLENDLTAALNDLEWLKRRLDDGDIDGREFETEVDRLKQEFERIATEAKKLRLTQDKVAKGAKAYAVEVEELSAAHPEIAEQTEVDQTKAELERTGLEAEANAHAARRIALEALGKVGNMIVDASEIEEMLGIALGSPTGTPIPEPPGVKESSCLEGNGPGAEAWSQMFSAFCREEPPATRPDDCGGLGAYFHCSPPSPPRNPVGDQCGPFALLFGNCAPGGQPLPEQVSGKEECSSVQFFSFCAPPKEEVIVRLATPSGSVHTLQFSHTQPAASTIFQQLGQLIGLVERGGGQAKAVARSTCGTVFTDVPKGHVACPAIEYLYARSMLQGDGNGTFRPQDPLTRAEMAKMVVTAMGWEPVPWIGVAPTPDTKGHWAAKEGFIGRVYLEGVMTGRELGRFNPQEYLTRAELVTIVVRAKKIPEDDSAPGYPEMNGQEWYRKAVAAAHTTNLIGLDGLHSSVFDPQFGFFGNQKVTRAEMARVMANLVKLRLSPGGGPASGIPRQIRPN